MPRTPATTMSNFPTRTAVSEAEDGKSWIPTPPPPFPINHLSLQKVIF